MHRCEQIIKRTPVKGLDVAMLHLTCVHGWDWHETLAVLAERLEPPASPERRCVYCEEVMTSAERSHPACREAAQAEADAKALATLSELRTCQHCDRRMARMPKETNASYGQRQYHPECRQARHRAFARRSMQALRDARAVMA